jgi:carbon storage regulator
MLVLSQKIGQAIQISGGIRVTVLRIRNGQVRLGIEAPDSVEILRDDAKSRQPQHNIPGAEVAPEYQQTGR